MKTLFLVLLSAFILTPGSALAQASYPVDRGSFIVAGSAALTSRSVVSLDDDERTTSVTINPDVKYFVIPNLALGGSGGFFFSSFSGVSNASVFLGPSVSYYFGGPNRKLYPFLSGSMQFDVEEFTDSASLLIEGGGAYMVARNVALTGTVFFSGRFENLSDQNVAGLRFGVKAFVF